LGGPPGEASKTLMRHTKTGPGVKAIDLSPDGKWLATVSWGVRIWSTQTGDEISSIDAGAPARLFPSAVTASSWPSPRTNGLATVWDRQTSKRIAGPFFHSASICSAYLSPDGQRLLTASLDHRARLWDIKTATGRYSLSDTREDCPVARFSPNGRRIVTASLDHTARVWDAETGAPITASLGHTDECLDACFSPDGKLVATAAKDNAARIWGRGHRPVGRATVPQLRSVEAVAFSPDGLRLVTTSLDHTARIWDVRTRRTFIAPFGA